MLRVIFIGNGSEADLRMGCRIKSVSAEMLNVRNLPIRLAQRICWGFGLGSVTGEKGEIAGGSRLFARKGAWIRRVEGLEGGDGLLPGSRGALCGGGAVAFRRSLKKPAGGAAHPTPACVSANRPPAWRSGCLCLRGGSGSWRRARRPSRGRSWERGRRRRRARPRCRRAFRRG